MRLSWRQKYVPTLSPRNEKTKSFWPGYFFQTLLISHGGSFLCNITMQLNPARTLTSSLLNTRAKVKIGLRRRPKADGGRFWPKRHECERVGQGPLMKYWDHTKHSRHQNLRGGMKILGILKIWEEICDFSKFWKSEISDFCNFWKFKISGFENF